MPRGIDSKERRLPRRHHQAREQLQVTEYLTVSDIMESVAWLALHKLQTLLSTAIWRKAGME